jgi:glycine dehydrogenase subunit 1
MNYLPHTEDDRRAMLEAIGVQTMEDLFADVPARCRFPELALPAPLSEPEVEAHMADVAGRNTTFDPRLCFLGAGTFNHYRPATVDYVLQRGELYTAYTPYQPELSQGTLQAAFEYQTMICRLTGMEVSNASHYDGATALAEGVLLALHETKGRRNKVLVSPGVHPQYREVLRTYLRGGGATVAGDGDPTTGIEQLKALLDGDTAALVVQNPSFFGHFEDVDGLADAVHAAGALLIVVVDPISLGLFRPPGSYGADVAVADGQPLGIPPTFGGPHLGIFAARPAYVRRLAGRLVGETVDVDGRRGYVLTLGTREQHIRRARATSNICTNAALSALAAAVYLATLGKHGLRQVAALCYHRSHYAAARIAEAAGLAINPHAPGVAFFKEFVVALPRPVAEVNQALRNDFGLLGGYDLGRDDPRLERHMLLAVTEMNPRAAIDRLADALARVTR